MTGFVIADIQSSVLTPEDKTLLKHPKLAGLILFARNYKNPDQLTALCADIRSVKPDAIIAVDQEGGQVQRFINGFTRLPSMGAWSHGFLNHPSQTQQALMRSITTLAKELTQCGINLDLVPVLDLNRGLNEVIGERSFSHDPLVVAELAAITVNALHKNHLPAVGKHFPGHGGVVADSHHELPHDTRAKIDIHAEDLLPFKLLAKQLDAIMPAHVVYDAFDELPATFSKVILQQILRYELGFEGVVISDDLSMTATESFGTYPKRAERALQAGCNLLLVCNNREGAWQCLSEASLKPSNESAVRIHRFVNQWIRN